MIQNLRRATRKESLKLAKYLGKTPVSWLRYLLQYGVPHYHAILKDLGDAKTIFNYSDNPKKKQPVSVCAKHFLETCRKRPRIKEYTERLCNGDPLEIIITVVRTEKADIIADGNHRAMACHLVGVKELPIHLIDIRYRGRK